VNTGMCFMNMCRQLFSRATWERYLQHMCLYNLDAVWQTLGTS
jgi:hypothetical protein